MMVAHALEVLTRRQVPFSNLDPERIGHWFLLSLNVCSNQQFFDESKRDLTFAHRSTLWHQTFVKVMGVICVLCWMGMMILIFARCTPIQRNWQIVPYAGDQCTLATSTYITLMVTNISWVISERHHIQVLTAL